MLVNCSSLCIYISYVLRGEIVPCVFTFLMYCVGKYVGHEGLTAFGSILLGMLYTFICLLFLATVFLFLVYAYYTLGGIAARHAVKHVSIQELESLSIEELKKLEYMTTSDTDVEARRVSGLVTRVLNDKLEKERKKHASL